MPVFIHCTLQIIHYKLDDRGLQKYEIQDV